MKLTEKLKTEIVNYYGQIDGVDGMDLSEIVEQTLDYLIDNYIIDLSEESEDGDLYESYQNSVWEFIEEEIM